MNVTLSIRKSQVSEDERAGAIRQTNGQYIVPLSGHPVLDADAAAELKASNGFVSIRRAELEQYVGKTVQLESGTFVCADTDQAAKMLYSYWQHQFGFSGGVFPSKGDPNRPGTAGRSYRFEAVQALPNTAQAEGPRIVASAASPF